MTLNFYPLDTHALSNQSNLMTQPAAFSNDEPSRDSFPSFRKRVTPKSDTEGNPIADRLTTEEKFELLSAYIDGEVSEHEQQLVEHWLETDSQMQQQYQAQIKLSSAIKMFFVE